MSNQKPVCVNVRAAHPHSVVYCRSCGKAELAMNSQRRKFNRLFSACCGEPFVDRPLPAPEVDRG
jgi:hypothetical protein